MEAWRGGRVDIVTGERLAKPMSGGWTEMSDMEWGEAVEISYHMAAAQLTSNAAFATRSADLLRQRVESEERERLYEGQNARTPRTVASNARDSNDADADV